MGTIQILYLQKVCTQLHENLKTLTEKEQSKENVYIFKSLLFWWSEYTIGSNTQHNIIFYLSMDQMIDHNVTFNLIDKCKSSQIWHFPSEYLRKMKSTGVFKEMLYLFRTHAFISRCTMEDLKGGKHS